MIGIVGGIGPIAGVDMYKRIIDNTIAKSDQDHLPVLLASLPGEIVDRMPFLLHGEGENPAYGIANVIQMLEKAGATLIAIACNTAHSPGIYDVLLQKLHQDGSKVDIVNLIDISIQEILKSQLAINRIGVMTTTGAYRARLFHQSLEDAGLTPVFLPYERHEELIHKPIFRIKASGDSVEEDVVNTLNQGIEELQEAGAQAILLGCTEIGMVEKSLNFGELISYNPNTIMARELIARYSPKKLK